MLLLVWGVNVSDVDRMTEAEGENELKSNAGNEL
jgi:hypothetical protein